MNYLVNSKGNPISGRDRNRMKVRISQDFTCKDCGKRRSPEEVSKHNKKISGLKGKIKLFDIHHSEGLCGKKSKGYDRIEDMSKLIVLCHKCHYNRPEHRCKSEEYRDSKRKKRG